jgi:hypothetical protein|tara:strand:- start:241 stop:555 length:315 start_codon:yes stop_codon:yes gene_type:complete
MKMQEGSIVIEDVPMTAEIRSKVAKESLPEGLSDVWDEMKDGQSFFMATSDVKRKMYALRSAYYRWKQKRPDDSHKFSFVKEDGGIRVYKYIPTGDELEDHQPV